MKRTPLVVTGALCLFFLLSTIFVGSPCLYAKEVHLRLAVPQPPGEFPITYGIEEMAKRFNARAKGQYKIEVFPGAALIKVPEYFDSLRIGAVEMVVVDWSLFSFQEPRLAATSVPFLLNNYEASSEAAEKFLPLHDELLREKFNIAGLGLYSVGGIHMMTEKPLTELAQWKGMLVGTGSQMTTLMFKELGASPVAIVWTDLYESLQKHVVDAVAQVTHGAVMTGLIDVAKNFTHFYAHSAYNGIAINLDVYNKMPADIKNILAEEVDTTEKFMAVQIGKLLAEDFEKMKEAGVDIHFLPTAEREKWVEKVAPFSAKQIENFGEFGRSIKAIADEANQHHPYKPIVLN